MDMVAPWGCEHRGCEHHCSPVGYFEDRYREDRHFEAGCDSYLAAADQIRGLCCAPCAGSPPATRPPAPGCRRSIRESWQKAGAPFRRARARVSTPEIEAVAGSDFLPSD